MRIGLCGSHGTGKTSVAEAFVAKYPDFKLVTSASRDVRALGYPINMEATVESQAATSMLRLAQQIRGGKSFISDRTLLDSVAYNRYQLENLWREDRSAAFWYDTMDTISRDYAQRYDLIVYFPIHFPLVGDGVRSEDVEYQHTIDRYVVELLGEYDLNYFTMPNAPVQERIDLIAYALTRTLEKW